MCLTVGQPFLIEETEDGFAFCLNSNDKYIRVSVGINGVHTNCECDENLGIELLRTHISNSKVADMFIHRFSHRIPNLAWRIYGTLRKLKISSTSYSKYFNNPVFTNKPIKESRYYHHDGNTDVINREILTVILSKNEFIRGQFVSVYLCCKEENGIPLLRINGEYSSCCDMDNLMYNLCRYNAEFCKMYCEMFKHFVPVSKFASIILEELFPPLFTLKFVD